MRNRLRHERGANMTAEIAIPERATPVYRALLYQIERRRQQVGLSMDAMSDEAGFADRYYSKALHADTPSGRQVQWKTVQEMLDALYPGGFDLKIIPKDGGCLSPQAMRRKIKFAAADRDARVRNELMAELGRLGGQARSKMSVKRKREIALKAAKTRARNRQLTRDTDQRSPGHHTDAG